MKSIDQSLNKFDMKKKLDTVLIANFRESYKDETFKKIADKLGMSYEELSKYTSTLEKCAGEYGHCLKCKNLLSCKNEVNGYAFLPDKKNGELRFGYKPCKYMLKQMETNKYLNNVYSSFEPDDIREAKIENIYLNDSTRLKLIEWITNYISDYRNGKINKGIYLYGSFGSGKTFIISSMFNELAKDGVKSAIIFWPEFLTSLKSSFGKDDYQEKMNRIKKSKLLLIDDIGAENTTSWSRDDILCPILQYRMQEKLPTFFTSNLDKKSLEMHFSITKDSEDVIKARRIMERVNQLTDDIELVSKNLRK